MSNKKASFKHTGVLETGVSDFHSLIFTVLKATYSRLPPKKISYRCYRNFNQEGFRNDLKLHLQQSLFDYKSWQTTIECVFDKHVSIKSQTYQR